MPRVSPLHGGLLLLGKASQLQDHRLADQEQRPREEPVASGQWQSQASGLGAARSVTQLTPPDGKTCPDCLTYWGEGSEQRVKK